VSWIATNARRRRIKIKIDVDAFVHLDLLKWTHNLKHALGAGHYAVVKPSNFRRSLYRPFCKKWLFFDRLLNERVYLTPCLFPNEDAEAENVVICCTTHTQMPFTCMVTNCLPNEAVGGRNGQCFGFYIYSADGHALASWPRAFPPRRVYRVAAAVHGLYP
jgi:predicted helicase